MLKIIFLDSAESWQLIVQDPASPSLEGMIFFHNYLLFYLVIIGTSVCWFLLKIIFFFNKSTNLISEKFTHSNLLEVVWTVFPALILLLISIPSFSLLYSLDEINNPSLTLKVIGHQWFWSYEYSDKFYINSIFVNKNIFFDSYMVQENFLTFGSFRLLEVDNRTMLPKNLNIRILISSTDVLHSWAVPSLGVKVDACPGRLSETTGFLKRAGVYYGQCSEICGINHGFMPIVINSIPMASFLSWRQNQI